MATTTRLVGNGPGSVSAAAYSGVATGYLATSTTEAVARKPFRTAGTLTRLGAYKNAGDRTGMAVNVRVGGATVNGAIAFTSTNGQYEDTSGSDSISAGGLVAFLFSPGTGGTTNPSVFSTCISWAATGTTTTHLLTTTGTAFSTGAQTSYEAVGGFLALNTTQAAGDSPLELAIALGTTTDAASVGGH